MCWCYACCRNVLVKIFDSLKLNFISFRQNSNLLVQMHLRPLCLHVFYALSSHKNAYYKRLSTTTNYIETTYQNILPEYISETHFGYSIILFLWCLFLTMLCSWPFHPSLLLPDNFMLFLVVLRHFKDFVICWALTEILNHLLL